MNLNFSANMAGFCRDSHICACVNVIKSIITLLYILDVMYNMNGTYCMYICMESLKLLQYFLAVKCLIDIFMKWSSVIAKILEVISLRLNSYYKTMMNCVTQ